MRILFGPSNDHRQTPDPAPSGAYEWWYFDALSEDRRFAVVAIFFLGSPMTPYYKAAVDGKNPDPIDWCGVFFTLHENIRGKWKERAYAYNLYHGGEFHADRPHVTVGDSHMTYDGVGTWTVSLHERGLWRTKVRAELRFTMPTASAALPSDNKAGREAEHAWICVAPVCAFEGQVQVNAQSVSFNGAGYHDHNFGRVPLGDVAAWYWARAELRCSDGAVRTAILYYLASNSGPKPEVTALIFDAEGNGVSFSDTVRGTESSPTTNAYGLMHPTVVTAESEQSSPNIALHAVFSAPNGAFSEGPFYRRLPVELTASAEPKWTGVGTGIGEVFVPPRLCGPIASRAMWSRMRRRSIRRP